LPVNSSPKKPTRNVPSQLVPKSTAGPTQLHTSDLTVLTQNLFKSNNCNTKTLTLTLTLTDTRGPDLGTSWFWDELPGIRFID